MSLLTFSVLREANIHRNIEVFNNSCASWSTSDWFMAYAGEVGELANLLKKINRGEHIPKRMLEDEIGDNQAYLDLLAHHLGIELDEATIQKFNEVSAKRNSTIFL